MDTVDLSLLSDADLARCNELMLSMVTYDRSNKIIYMYPEEGPLSRHNYPKHTSFFTAGKENRERLMLAANRVGKTEGVGGYEVTMHLTGLYPEWWDGHRFDHPVTAWAAGDTATTVKEIIQTKLLGANGDYGSGLIPKKCIIDVVAKRGLSQAADSILVKHITGGNSRIVLKSYDQRRESFQGVELDVVWLDEEPPLDIYTECLMRTMTTGGLVICTFTPLAGMSHVVRHFMPDGIVSTAVKFLTVATWDDAPHLTEQAKKDLYDALPPHQREARSKGIPSLGSGAIFAVNENTIKCEPFPIPDFWPRLYGLDVGWSMTAAIWGAINPEDGVTYLYSEYSIPHAEPATHAQGILARGKWIPGLIDPASLGSSIKDGKSIMSMYKELGLDIQIANNSVEAGIHTIWQALCSGNIKVFSNLKNWLSEYRLYRRDDKGKIVKEHDHLMDATRYMFMSKNNARCQSNVYEVPESCIIDDSIGY